MCIQVWSGPKWLTIEHLMLSPEPQTDTSKLSITFHCYSLGYIKKTPRAKWLHCVLGVRRLLLKLTLSLSSRWCGIDKLRHQHIKA